MYVGRNFFCYNNLLTSLEYGPKIVGGDYYCMDNKITSIKGFPDSVGGLIVRIMKYA